MGLWLGTEGGGQTLVGGHGVSGDRGHIAPWPLTPSTDGQGPHMVCGPGLELMAIALT